MLVDDELERCTIYDLPNPFLLNHFSFQQFILGSPPLNIDDSSAQARINISCAIAPLCIASCFNHSASLHCSCAKFCCILVDGSHQRVRFTVHIGERSANKHPLIFFKNVYKKLKYNAQLVGVSSKSLANSGLLSSTASLNSTDAAPAVPSSLSGKLSTSSDFNSAAGCFVDVSRLAPNRPPAACEHNHAHKRERRRQHHNLEHERKSTQSCARQN